MPPDKKRSPPLKTQLRLSITRNCASLMIALAVIASVSLLASSAHSAPQPQAMKKADTYYLLVFSNPVPGTEDEYNKWYDTQHAPDVTAVPGFVSAQRYVVSDKQLRIGDPLPKYLVLYKIVTDNLPSVYDEVHRRLKTGETKMSLAFESKTSVSFSYKLITPIIYHQGDQPKVGKDAHTYVQIVFSNATAGMEDEFNRWYDKEHAEDVVNAPGFVNVQRFVLSDPQLVDKPQPYKYLAFFELKSDDIAARFADFKRIAPTHSKSAAMGPSAGYTYMAIGPMIDGDKVRSERAEKKLSSSK
jgi:hypothetical protein